MRVLGQQPGLLRGHQRVASARPAPLAPSRTTRVSVARVRAEFIKQEPKEDTKTSKPETKAPAANGNGAPAAAVAAPAAPAPAPAQQNDALADLQHLRELIDEVSKRPHTRAPPALASSVRPAQEVAGESYGVINGSLGVVGCTRGLAAARNVRDAVRAGTPPWRLPTMPGPPACRLSRASCRLARLRRCMPLSTKSRWMPSLRQRPRRPALRASTWPCR